MRVLAVIFLSWIPALYGAEPGVLQFNLGGKSFSTSNALGFFETKKGKTRIHIGVKDVSAKFMLMITAEVPAGDEKKPLILTTEDSSLSLTLRSAHGSLAVLPHRQLAQPTDSLYTQRVEVETEELEEIPVTDHTARMGAHGDRRQEKKYRKKIRIEYHKVKPKWHSMSSKERLQSGEGVIENGAFRDSYMLLQLNPVISGGKVVAINGTFGGSGRMSTTISGAQQKSIEGGSFNVRVQYAP